jgi:hypothetical protein
MKDINVGNKFAIGHIHSEQTKKRMSDSHKGIRPDEETKKKLSEKRKEYWILKKINQK